MFSPPTWRSRLFCAAADVLIGAFVSLAIFYSYQARQEDYHFSRLVHTALSLPPENDNLAPLTEDNALLIMHKVNEVACSRREQVAEVGYPRPGVLWSSEEHLREPSGACASFTQVLATALQTAGYPIRKVGLSKNGQPCMHHVLETHVEGRWVLMDALFNLAFRRPDGRLASAAEVHDNWEYYRRQTPPDYNPDYDYAEYYHTNWNRIPVVGAAVRAMPSLQAWLNARGFSLRFLLLNVNHWFMGACLTGAATLLMARLSPKVAPCRQLVREAMQRRTSTAGTRKSFGGAPPYGATSVLSAQP